MKADCLDSELCGGVSSLPAGRSLVRDETLQAQRWQTCWGLVDHRRVQNSWAGDGEAKFNEELSFVSAKQTRTFKARLCRTQQQNGGSSGIFKGVKWSAWISGFLGWHLSQAVFVCVIVSCVCAPNAHQSLVWSILLHLPYLTNQRRTSYTSIIRSATW